MNENFEIEVVTAVLERTIRRLWILCIILIVLLAVTNGAWIWYESQFEDVVTTESVEQDVDSGDGNGDTTISGIGDIINGENTPKSDKNDNDQAP